MGVERYKPLLVRGSSANVISVQSVEYPPFRHVKLK